MSLSKIIEIDFVRNKTGWKDFLELPAKIYEDNEYWVSPRLNRVRDSLNVRENPLWASVRHQIFLVRKNGVAVERIVSIIKYNYISFHQDKPGFFGFFEYINNFTVARHLLDEAKGWLQKNGMKIMRGPINTSLNDECGFSLRVLPLTNKNL